MNGKFVCGDNETHSHFHQTFLGKLILRGSGGTCYGVVFFSTVGKDHYLMYLHAWEGIYICEANQNLLANNYQSHIEQ